MEIKPNQIFLDQTVLNEVNLEEIIQQYDYQTKHKNLTSRSISTINGVTLNYLNDDLHLLLSEFTSWVVSNNSLSAVQVYPGVISVLKNLSIKQSGWSSFSDSPELFT